MAKSARKIKKGDLVTIQVPVVEVYEDMSVFIVEIDGKKNQVHCDWGRITDVKPYDPKSVYKRVR